MKISERRKLIAFRFKPSCVARWKKLAQKKGLSLTRFIEAKLNENL